MSRFLFATFAASMIAGLTGCAADTERDASVRSDAGRDVRGVDSAPMRDALVGDSAIDAGIDSPGTDVPDVRVVAVDVIRDEATDTGPPLPVSCERTGAADCSPFMGTGRCPDGPTAFGRDVNAAIDAMLAEHPAWFVTAGYASCCPLIQPANVNDYMQAVTDHLATAGLCASGPGEELAVKFNNECSESWDIVANPDAMTSLVRRHYVGNCFPSFF